MNTNDFDSLRKDMVDRHVASQGGRARRVLDAMRTVVGGRQLRARGGRQAGRVAEEGPGSRRPA